MNRYIYFKIRVKTSVGEEGKLAIYCDTCFGEQIQKTPINKNEQT